MIRRLVSIKIESGRQEEGISPQRAVIYSLKPLHGSSFIAWILEALVGVLGVWRGHQKEKILRSGYISYSRGSWRAILNNSDLEFICTPFHRSLKWMVIDIVSIAVKHGTIGGILHATPVSAKFSIKQP